MSIRVVCTTCHSVSEVVDEAMGAQATCPFCSAVFEVPNETFSDTLTSPVARTSSHAAANGRSEAATSARRRPLTDTPIDWGQLDPRKCCQIAIELYKAHPRLLLAAHSLYLVAMFGSSWLLQSLSAAGRADLAGILQFASIALILYLNIAVSLLALRVARNDIAEVGFLLTGGDRLLRILAFNLLFTLIVGIGCVGFVVPGIYLATRYWSGSWFILDQNCTVFEAFGLAAQFSDGNRLPSVMLGVISLCLAVCGVAFFGIGLLLVYPLLTLIWTIAYLMITRQPIERPVA